MVVPQPVLDPTPQPGKIAQMIRRLIHSAIRSSMQEVIEPSLLDLKASVARLEAGQARHELRMDRLDTKIDEGINRLDAKIDAGLRGLDAKIDVGLRGLDAKIDAGFRGLGTKIDAGLQGLDAKFSHMDTKFGRLESRLDEFGVQQGRLIKEVASLQREHETTHDILNRLGRIEDRLLRVELSK